MKDAEERLKAEHRRVRLRNNRFLMGLALFAAGYLLLELDWIMIGALLYLAVILADMHRGQKELARAYAAEEEGCLQELNFWLESVSGRKPDEKTPGLVCGYREKEGRFSQCLLYREGENLYSLGSILEKHKVYSVSNQATYLLSIKKKSRRDAAQKLALSPEGSNGHRRGESLAASTSHTVFSIFGGKEAEKLRKEGLREFARIRGAEL